NVGQTLRFELDEVDLRRLVAVAVERIFLVEPGAEPSDAIFELDTLGNLVVEGGTARSGLGLAVVVAVGLSVRGRIRRRKFLVGFIASLFVESGFLPRKLRRFELVARVLGDWSRTLRRGFLLVHQDDHQDDNAREQESAENAAENPVQGARASLGIAAAVFASVFVRAAITSALLLFPSSIGSAPAGPTWRRRPRRRTRRQARRRPRRRRLRRRLRRRNILRNDAFLDRRLRLFGDKRRFAARAADAL